MPPRTDTSDQRSDLHRAKLGVAVVATCIVETINDSDPTFRERFLKKMSEAYYKLRDDTPGDQIEQMELLTWTRSLLTGFDFVDGQGQPFLDSVRTFERGEAD